MDTKARIIETATALFQQKGYKGVGLNEILKECKITKGSLYHHFPNGKEELLLACLQSMKETITTEVEDIYKEIPNALEATKKMIDRLVSEYDREGTIAGYTFSSMVSEMASLNEPVRNACSSLYKKIQEILSNRLIEDGFSKGKADSLALAVIACIEGALMLCLTQQSSEPLIIVSQVLPNLWTEKSY